jgi:hypothetical protein
MQSLHSLFDGRFIVESMKLENIDVFQLESLQGILDRCEDPLIISFRPSSSRVRTRTDLSAGSPVVHQSCRPEIFRLGIRVVSLGENDNTLSGHIVSLEKFAENDFRFSVRIGVGCIERLRLVRFGLYRHDATYVYAFVIGVLELPDPFVVICDHPVLP